ncbi:c-type cytochrome [Crenalkalicoccus roseus]|uniref:c-type cytochrome n=1 Tax=Crenalkalicoccus roseus TaxID=1485588 RepID=UPI0030841180
MRARFLLAAAFAAAAFASPAWAGDLRRGEAAAEACAACHGQDGRSQMPGVPSLAGMPAEFTVLQMILFREGLRNAAPMTELARGLSDAEIEALAAWYAALPPGPPDDLPPRDPALAERGRALSARHNCGVCHLPDYRGRAQMPRLAAQREDYLIHALTEYRDNRRVGTDTQMNGIMYGMPDEDIAALAHYLAHAP